MQYNFQTLGKIIWMLNKERSGLNSLPLNLVWNPSECCQPRAKVHRIHTLNLANFFLTLSKSLATVRYTHITQLRITWQHMPTVGICILLISVNMSHCDMWHWSLCASGLLLVSNIALWSPTLCQNNPLIKIQHLSFFLKFNITRTDSSDST